MTGREMCERISAEYERRYGEKIDPRDIWDMSPTGELWPVFEMYWALFPKERPADEPPDRESERHG